MLGRLIFLSVWSISRNLTRRCITEARQRLCGAFGWRGAGVARGGVEEQPWGKGLEQIAGVGRNKVGILLHVFLEDSRNALFVSNIFLMGGVGFFSFFLFFFRRARQC